MARKKASKYARLGKKSKGRRGFQGRKAEANSSAGNIDFSVESGTITTTDAVTHRDESEAGPSRTVSVCTNNLEQQHTLVKYRDVMNKTKQKLSRNSLFNTSYKGKTRSQTTKFSRRKRKNVKAENYKLINADMLVQSIQKAAICSICNICKQYTYFKTSMRGSQSATLPAYDVNIRSVYASQTMGRAGLGKFCTIMDIPQPINREPYNRIQKKLSETTVVETQIIMKEAADRLSQDILAENDPENVVIDDENRIITNISVTVDGTWQKRGHTSKIGCVFVLSVRSGEVLDYEVCSLVCHQCVAAKSARSNADFDTWYEMHKSKCQINHTGTSDAMEANGAVKIFLRSIEKRHLKYITFVGDGDSSCFGKVAEACVGKYGETYIVTKEECVGHVQKRMGARLREYKRKNKGKILGDGKSVGGKGRLGDKIIDKMQNFYGQAIRNNVGEIEQMRNDIWAIFNHMIKDDEKTLAEQHSLCPTGITSWCKFNRERTLYTENNRIPYIFKKELEPIFIKLSDDTLLLRCISGHTQNQNESINGMLWAKCPKYKFAGKAKVELAACDTINIFNSGAASKARVMSKSGVNPGSNMFFGLKLEDNERLNHAERKTSIVSRRLRRKRRAQKKTKPNEYISGGFGLSAQPDCKLYDKKHNTDHALCEVVVTFVDDNDIPDIIMNQFVE